MGSLAGQYLDINIRKIDTNTLGFNASFSNGEVDTLLNTKCGIDYIDKDDLTSIAYEGMSDCLVDSSGNVDSTKPAEYNSSDCLLVNNHENASKTIGLCQNAVKIVSDMRSNLVATQNRLEHTGTTIDYTGENMTAAESRIRDTDMAKEMVGYSTSRLLKEAGQSMLAQANQSPAGVLKVLNS